MTNEILATVYAHTKIRPEVKDIYALIVKQPLTANEIRVQLDLKRYKRPDMAIKHFLDELVNYGLIKRNEQRQCTIANRKSWDWVPTGEPPKPYIDKFKKNGAVKRPSAAAIQRAAYYLAGINFARGQGERLPSCPADIDVVVQWLSNGAV